MTYLTYVLIMMSFRSSILIAIILLSKRILNNFFTAQAHYFIWFLLFISLTVPYSPVDNNNFFNIDSIRSENFQNKTLYGHNTPIKPIENINSEIVERSIGERNENTSFGNFHLRKAWSPLNVLTKSNRFMIVISYVWLFGFVLLSFITLIRAIHFHRLVIEKKVSHNIKSEQLLNNCRAYLNINSEVALIESEKFVTPFLAGLFHPTIFIPVQIVNDFDTEKLKFIFLHELAHIKRKDIVINWVILVYKLIYWFNPLIWIGFNRMKCDMEVACDAFVLKNLRKNEYISYGKVIIELLQYHQYTNTAPISISILKSKSEVERRIRMIKKYGKIPRILPIISCLIVILVGCTSITIPIQKAIDVENTDKLVVTEQTQNFENYISLSKAKDVMSRKEDFIGKEFSRSYEEIGSPSLTTRYIDYDDMIEDTHTTPEEYIYPINSESGKSALYIYLDNHKVLDVKIDDFSGVPDNKWRVTPYTVNSYSLNLGIGTNIDVIEIQDTKMELNIDAVKEMYLNKPLLEFKVKYELIHGFNEVYKNGTELNLSVFPIIDENNASGSGGLYVLSDNGIIKAIKIDRPDVEMERLDEHFSSESY